MDIFMYGMFLLPLAVFVPIYVAEKVGAPNWYLILTGVMFGFVLTSFWRWVNKVSVEYISIPKLWTVNVLVSLAALALFYIVKSLRPREVCTLPPQAGYYTSTNYTMNTEKESLDDEETPENHILSLAKFVEKPVPLQTIPWDETEQQTLQIVAQGESQDIYAVHVPLGPTGGTINIFTDYGLLTVNFVVCAQGADLRIYTSRFQKHTS